MQSFCRRVATMIKPLTDLTTATFTITFRLPSDNPTCRQAACRRSEQRAKIPSGFAGPIRCPALYHFEAVSLHLSAYRPANLPPSPRLPRTPIGLPTPYRPPLRFAERTIL